MNTTFIILMLLSCGAIIATFMSFASAMYCRRYKDNGAYKLDMHKHLRITAIWLILCILLSGATVFAATNCQNCGKIAMNEYCTHCGTHVEANDNNCDSCNAKIYHGAYCGYCGAEQGG